MATFEENEIAIEENRIALLSLSGTLASEVSRAVSSENYFVSEVNLNPFMHVDELIPESVLTDAYLNRVYLLLSPCGKYSCGHAYRVDKDGSGNLFYQDITATDVHLSNVADVKRIPFENGAYVWWKDPDDVVVQGETIVRWAGTKLVCKSYDSRQFPESGAYPTDIDDGMVVADSSVRNQYSSTPCTIEGLDGGRFHYFRFFPYSDEGDAMLSEPMKNSFMMGDEFDWKSFVEILEDYPSYVPYLPEPGSSISLKYMETDGYSGNGGTFLTAHTRSSVMSSKDFIPTIDTDWILLGYNAETPQFVKYRRRKDDGSDGWDYIYVSSVNDGTYAASFIDLDGRFTSREVLSGDMFLKTAISAGDRTYRMEYDTMSDTPTYYFSGMTVDSISDISEEGGGFTYGSNDTFTVPARITVNGQDYAFCGYNATLQSKMLLTGVADGTGTLLRYVQFDPSEDDVVNACNTYATFANRLSDYGYYCSDGDSVFRAIDVKGQSLEGEDVQFCGDGGLVFRATYPDSPFHDSRRRKIPRISQETEVYRSGHVYVNLSGVILAENVDYTVGDVILSEDHVLEMNLSIRVTSGCGIYSQSLVRQISNSTFGSSDDWWRKRNRWDMKGDCEWLYSNGVMLKLSKNDGFLSRVVPIVVKCGLAVTNSPYVPKYVVENSRYYEYCIDRMSISSIVEANLNNGSYTSEGCSSFGDVFTDDDSRVKRLCNADGSPGVTYTWWLRTPRRDNAALIARISATGTLTNNPVKSNLGLAPSFTVG